MMEYIYTKEGSLLEGSRMEENLLWGPDLVLFDSSVDVSTLNHDIAPINLGTLPSISEAEQGLKVDDVEWTTGVFLDSYVNSDFDKSFLHQTNDQEHSLFLSASVPRDEYFYITKQPASPANSYDSGVGSPGSDASSVVMESSSLSAGNVVANVEIGQGQPEEPITIEEFSSNCFSFPLHSEHHAAATAISESSGRQQEIIVLSEQFRSEIAQTIEPTFNFSESLELTADDLAAIIGPSSSTESNGVNVEASLPYHSYINTTSNFIQTTAASTISSELVQASLVTDASSTAIHETAPPDFTTQVLLESTSSDSSSSSVLSSPNILISAPASSSPKSRNKRKSKITTVQEKKQRKRDQNKHAATRYRERKRQENAEREGEYKVLETRNKELKDKVSQIRSEMDYLRELMIEVYTLKGLIS